MLKCQAVDWTAQPKGFLSNLQTGSGDDSVNATTGGVTGNDGTNATELRQFGLALHQLWGLLCKEVRNGLLVTCLMPAQFAKIILSHVCLAG